VIACICSGLAFSFSGIAISRAIFVARPAKKIFPSVLSLYATILSFVSTSFTEVRSKM